MSDTIEAVLPAANAVPKRRGFQVALLGVAIAGMVLSVLNPLVGIPLCLATGVTAFNARRGVDSLVLTLSLASASLGLLAGFLVVLLLFPTPF